MQAEDFIDAATDAGKWRTRSARLRTSADHLYDEWGVQGNRVKTAEPDDPDYEVQAERLRSLIQTTQLLYGLAIETALKAYLIEYHPDKVEIAVVADGNGRATKASIRQIGTHSKDGHNLYKLALAAEILTPENFDDRQIKVLHGLLKHLAQMVRWQSRYPVPLASGNQFYLGDAIPDDVKGSDPKRWIDMVLDTCLETPAV